MKLLHKLLLASMLSICAHFAYAENTNFISRVAIVDVLAILDKSLAIQSIKTDITKISQEIHNELSKKELEFKKYEDDLSNKKKTLSTEAFEAEVIKFNKNVAAAQREVEDKKRKLEHAHAEAMNKVHQETIAIINDLSKELNFNMAIPSSQILFVAEEFDITTRVLDKLNKKITSVKVNYQ